MSGRSIDMDGQSEMLNNNQVKSKEDLASQPVQHRRNLYRYGPVVMVVALILLTAIILIAVGSSMGSGSRESSNPGATHYDVNAASITSEPTSSPTNSPTLYQDVAMTDFLMEALGDNDVEASRIIVAGTVQWKAKRWLVHDDPLALNPVDNSVPRWRILQRYAIAATHFSFLGEDDLNLDWMSMDECESVHINCDDDGYIRALVIDQIITGGSIPDEIGLFGKLENLIIKNNQFLVGTIPDGISKNQALRQIGFSNNSLTGTLPYGIYKLPLLTYLNLSDNYLSGSLSKDLGQLTNLEKLILDNNDFTGHLLPLPLRQTQINVLSLSGNRFSSDIVPAMRFLMNLEFLYLDGNEFVGSLPSDIGGMSQLKSFSLSRNQFTGTLPFGLGELSGLRYLNMAGNNFVGPLNESIFENFIHLEILLLGKNNFTGIAPSILGNLDSLDTMDYTWVKDGTDIGS